MSSKSTNPKCVRLRAATAAKHTTPVLCTYCGDSFIRRTEQQIYCSPFCRASAARERLPSLAGRRARARELHQQRMATDPDYREAKRQSSINSYHRKKREIEASQITALTRTPNAACCVCGAPIHRDNARKYCAACKPSHSELNRRAYLRRKQRSQNEKSPPLS